MRQAQRPLSPGWVAGSVRARNMLARRLGWEQARALASAGSLANGISALAGGAYGRFVRPGLDLGGAQRGCARTALWHIRVLAGWLPPRALEPVRALVAWFELVNVEDRLAYLVGPARGGPLGPPFELGGLATVWPLIGSAQSAADVRRVLAGSRWGDPGADDPVTVGLGLRLAWGRRVIDDVPEAAAWASGAVGLLLARELLLSEREPSRLAARRPPGVGEVWERAADPPSLRRALPAQAGWSLAGIEVAADLWRGEAAWWRRVQRDAALLARDPHLGRPAVVGSITLLAVDAWRVAAALACAARGGTGTFEEIA